MTAGGPGFVFGRRVSGYSRSHANRGMGLERVLAAVHAVYRREGIAVVEKIPTPIRLIRWHNAAQFIGCFEKKSTVDYQGYLMGGGRYVGVEAKQCSEKTLFKMDNLHVHQRECLSEAEKAGGLAVVLVYMSKLDEYWAFRYGSWAAMETESKRAGRASIPYAVFASHGVLCGSIRGVPGDYLGALSREGSEGQDGGHRRTETADKDLTT